MRLVFTEHQGAFSKNSAAGWKEEEKFVEKTDDIRRAGYSAIYHSLVRTFPDNNNGGHRPAEIRLFRDSCFLLPIKVN